VAAKKVATRAVHQGVNASGGRSEYVRLNGQWWMVYSKHSSKFSARNALEHVWFRFGRRGKHLRVVKLNTGKWAVVQMIGKRYERKHSIY